MGTRSTSCTQKSRTPAASRLTLSPSGYYIAGSESKERLFSRQPDLADLLAAAVLEREDGEIAQVEIELSEECRGRRPDRAPVAVFGLQRHADPVSRSAEQAFRSSLCDPARRSEEHTSELQSREN